MLTRRERRILAGAAATALSGRDALAADGARMPADLDAPRGAQDGHAHVLPAPARFPVLPDRADTPLPTTADDLSGLQRSLSLNRIVLVQPSVHG